MGYTEHQLGDLAEATASYQRALTIARESGDRLAEGAILDHHGDIHDTAGELPKACETWQQALAIFELFRR